MKTDNLAIPVQTCDASNRADLSDADYQAMLEPVGYDFGLKRRAFVQLLGAGLLIAAQASPALAQQRGGGRRGGFGGSGARTIGARIHLGVDGSITVLCGKVEGGQGARTEMTQAAAEELRVEPSRIQLILGDTALVPDDGITAGSGSTPRTVPEVRRAAASARNFLLEFAAKKWEVAPDSCHVEAGKASHEATHRSLSYADLAGDTGSLKQFADATPGEVTLIPAEQFSILGKPILRPNGRDIVTGAHQYPSDIQRPGMLYGKILRGPAYGAKLVDLDPRPAQALNGVKVIRDDQFAGVVAPTTFRAEQAIAALAKTAKWETVSNEISSQSLYDDLKKNVRGGLPANPFTEEITNAKHSLRGSYHVAYVQHAPLEPRAAVAEWPDDGQLTVWASTQNPFGHRRELGGAFHLSEDKLRVIVPDFGAGFGGKHTGECSVEAARLAKAAGKPVSLRWTREEEFTWAYFRPAGVIETEASLNAEGKLTSWHFLNINSGPSAIETPYNCAGKKRDVYLQSTPPLRHGSYRGLAATANTFARECFMDELAAAAGMDPLKFRLAHLENDDESTRRLRAVLEAAAQNFDWAARVQKKSPNIGVGLACGTEKGSYVAACVEIEIDREQANPNATGRGASSIKVRHVSQTFECGAILNPDNLRKQVEGAIVMGLGPALREEMRFENGRITNASFRKYEVPRFDDLPEIDIQLLNRPDLRSAGAGETPIIAVAPAIANAVYHATGSRIRQMPIRLA
jgi:isoquinoline 1-oxidoreductase subunit beta